MVMMMPRRKTIDPLHHRPFENGGGVRPRRVRRAHARGRAISLGRVSSDWIQRDGVSEIEQARKRQLVETFLKHEMQLPTIEKSDDDEDGANATRGAEDALEASLRDDEKKEGKKNDDDDVNDDDIAQLKRRLATSQLEARKNLRLAKRTRRLCDAMVQMLKDKGVEQLEPPRAL